MAFDESAAENAKITRTLGGTFLEWESSAPEGTVFQVYVDGILVASTTSRWAMLPPGRPDRSRTIIVGGVDPDEAEQNLAAGLPATGLDGDRALLTWYGGRYLGESLSGFLVYRSAVSGGAVSYAVEVADVPAAPFGAWSDGAGLGRAGKGRAGRAEQSYSWRSPPMATGVWRWGVKPVDAAGNLGTAVEVDSEIIAPPAPPVADNRGRRISYGYTPGTGVAVLTWS